MSTTPTSTKSVRFAQNNSTAFSYPRVEAIDIENVHYQDEDYRRFRQEIWLEKMCLARAEARDLAIKTLDTKQLNKQSSRRDTIRNYGKNSRAKVQQQGIALAA